MTKFVAILFALLFSTALLRADLVLEQQISDTNSTRTMTMKLHGDMMRMDLPEENFSVIANLKTRDSYTLLTTNKTYLWRFGSEIRWEMSEERKRTHGTNEMDAAPARPVDTGKSEIVNGYNAGVYIWKGAFGLNETLWVARNFPNFAAIRPELYKLDVFNDTGPHRNAQPILSMLPGMVLRSVSRIKGHSDTNTLVSVKVEPVDASLFSIPTNYTAWKRPGARPETNAPAH